MKLSFFLAAVVISLSCALSLSPRQARAVEPPIRNILFSVGSAQLEHETQAWTQENCTALHTQMSELMRSSITSACVGTGIDPEASRKVQKARESKDFHYHVLLQELSDGSFNLQVSNWKSGRDDTDFQEVGWKISKDSPESQRQLIGKMLNHIASYDQNERKLKEMLLANGLMESKDLLLVDGEYYSHFRRVSFESAYDIFKKESSKQRNFLRASLEILATLGLGAVQYYAVTLADNKVDWDYNNWTEYRQKISSFESWRFDTNTKGVNIGHAFAGALYYWSARSNGFKSLESLLFAITGSTLWEYIAEAREKVSINDQIVTPVGGFIIGEVLYQFGDFFARGGKKWPNRILSSIFAAPQHFHAWIDQQKLPRAGSIDQYGFNADLWHQFSASAGYAFEEDSGAGNGVSAGFDMELVKLQAYGKEGRASEFMKDTVMTKLTADIVFGKNGMLDVSGLLKAVVAAYYRQDITKDERGRLNGYSFLIGPTSSVEYRSQAEIGGVTGDWHATVNVIGTGIDVVAYAKDVRVQFKLDVYPNFTLIRSLAIEDYAAVYGRDGIKTVLNANDYNNYYFAFGATGSSSLTVSYRGLELGGSVDYGYYDSVEGLDRLQEQLTRDVKLHDRYLSLKAWFSHPVYRKNIRMVYSIEHIQRSGDVEQVSRSARVNRYMGRLVFLF